MSSQTEWTARLEAVECPAFGARRDARSRSSGAEMPRIVYAHASGSRVTDVDGAKYIDLIAGFGALALGHRHAPLEAVVDDARSRLTMALGDVYASPEKVELCERLAALVAEPGARVLLGSSGADALTAALKTALLATGKPGIVAFEGGYHGLSHGPLAACGLSAAFRDPFAAHLLGPVRFAPYPIDDLERSLAAVEAALAPGDVGAILVEPLLGRGGALAPPADFLPALRALADQHGALLVVDEVWTGLGRTGSLLASNVLPDLLCLGKALGGGYPISACIGRAGVMQAWAEHGGSLVHTATHFGAPFAVAAANFMLGAVPDWLERVASLGAAQRRPTWSGRGLMMGVPLTDSAAALRAMSRLAQRGVLVLTGGKAGNWLTLSPAYNIPENELAHALALVEEETRG